MFRNPLTNRVFVFVYLTFEPRYLPLHCLRFPCWSQTPWLCLSLYFHLVSHRLPLFPRKTQSAHFLLLEDFMDISFLSYPHVLLVVYLFDHS